MMYLDTHVIVWLYGGFMSRFSKKALSLLEKHDLVISPMVYLEAQYLYEINRLQSPADVIINELTQRLGLSICDTPFIQLVKIANEFDWTRDPFDRLIVAAAKSKEALLLSKDTSIIKNYSHSTWD